MTPEERQRYESKSKKVLEVREALLPIVKRAGTYDELSAHYFERWCRTWATYLVLQDEMARCTEANKDFFRKLASKEWKAVCKYCREFQCVPINQTRRDVKIRLKGKRERKTDWNERSE